MQTPSSTSNSKKTFPLRAMLAAGAFLFVFTLLVESGMLREIEGRDPAQKNLIRADRFIGNAKEWPFVMVGSSMGVRIHLPKFGEDFFNLSFANGNALVSLEVLGQSGKKPEVVLVEMSDTLLKGVDHPILVKTKDPINRRLKRWIPVFRESYQPIEILAGLTRPRTGDSPPPSPEQVQYLVRMLQPTYALAPKPEVLAHVVQELAEKIETLRRQGTRVYLVEMPIHRDLRKSNKNVLVQAALRERFPTHLYPWISPPEAEDYESFDGLHLAPESAARYSQQIETEILKKESLRR